MSRKLKTIILRAIRKGFNPCSLAVNLCINKSVYGLNENDYNSYCEWVKHNECFWYWMQKRLKVFEN